MIRQLTAEHALIRRVLVLFGRHCEHMLATRTFDPVLTRAFLRFFHEYCDQRHHAKEERLFAWMHHHGLDLATGPLAVLHLEHEEASTLSAAMTGAVAILEARPDSLVALEELHRLALGYAALLTVHIEKEEEALFPIAEVFALQSGTECEEDAEEPPAYEEELWLDDVERRAGDWPEITLRREGLGTSYGFYRLCKRSLN